MSPLIHIGYHKTATSWLQKNLFVDHPQIEMPFNYEQTVENIVFPNSLYFSIEATKNFFSSGIDSVSSRNIVPVLSAERLCGNPHSGGYDSKEIADRLYGVFPSAKVLIVVRNQVDMIASTYKQYIMADGVATLDEYLQGANPERYPSFNLDHFSYDRLAKYYMSIFGDENVKLMFFEDFCKTPNVFANNILAFMGVEAVPENGFDFNKKVNKSLSDTSYRALRILNKFTKNPEMLNFPLISVPGRVAFRRLANGVDKILKINNSNYYKHKVREAIGGYYTDSNKRLSTIVDEDLSAKGYR